MTSERTAVGYVRLSQQSDRSLATQRTDIRDYCTQSKLSLVEIYNEGEGASGYDNDRAEYTRMLSYIEEHEIDAVVVRDHARLSRDRKERLRLLLDLDTAGVELHSVERGEAVRSGLDIRYPYLDSRVFEYLFNTALGELFSNGKTKGGFITEFEDILPDTVLQQDSKAYFTPLYTTGLQKNRRRIRDLLTNSTLETLGIVDSSKMDVIRRHPETLKSIWELINIELWLQSRYMDC